MWKSEAGNRFTFFMLDADLYKANAGVIGMTIVNRFPHLFNYPVKITKENAFRQYANASRMMRYLKFISVVILGVISFKTIPNAAGTSDELGEWFFILFEIHTGLR